MKKYKLEEYILNQVYKALIKYTPIPDHEWCKLKAKLHCVKLKKNEFFIKTGENPDKIGFVIKGLFRIFYLTEAGNDITLVFRDEHKFLAAFSSYLEGTTSKYDFQALEDSIIVYISLEDYSELASHHTCWQNIMQTYSQWLFVEKERRETELLCDDAQTRYHNFISKSPQLIHRISQYHIASYLGIKPETLSRIRKKSIDIDQ